jgi:Flp pilus assembly pilin Flp
MKAFVNQLWKDEQGQDLTEYALLVVLIGLAAVTAMKGLATAISNTFSAAAVSLS